MEKKDKFTGKNYNNVRDILNVCGYYIQYIYVCMYNAFCDMV